MDNRSVGVARDTLLSEEVAAAVSGGFEVELDEAWAAGSALLSAGDGIAAGRRAGLLLGCVAYGSTALELAAQRFADRFTHTLIQGFAEEAVAAGQNLHATVRDYEDVDILAPGLFPTAPTTAVL